ncbi:3-dehydroquinate dehydratase [Chitinispirillum alkaliphilum]|nr:3-dehydroquinate dehydratase [Chitinispirillum alkaliphilum]
MAGSEIKKFKRNPGVVLILDKLITPDKLLLFRDQGVDLLELRVDLIDAPFSDILSFLKSVPSEVRLPVIGTIRETKSNSHDRVNMFKQIMPYLDYVDIELGSPISEQVVRAAEDTIVMVSEHDFVKTPDLKGLAEIVNRSVEQGAQVVKIAVMANCSEDVARLLTFTNKCDIPLVSIAMGEHGKVSRVIAPLFDSLFTYGFEGVAVAPGQISVDKLIEELDFYFPARKGN